MTQVARDPIMSYPGPHTPLHLGEVIYPGEQDYDRVTILVQKNGKEMLARGLLCEYAHNRAFINAGWQYQTTATTGVYDRIFAGLKQDDKLATLNYDTGELSTTHTISQAEHFLWLKEPDVIIHSFEEMDDNRNGSRYRGTISFRKLLEHDLIRPSQYDNGWYFNRIAALKLARA